MENTTNKNSLQNSTSKDKQQDLAKDSSAKSTSSITKSVSTTNQQAPEKKSHEEQTQDGKKIKETDPNNPKADKGSAKKIVDQSDNNSTNQSDDYLKVANQEKVSPSITFSSKLNSEVESSIIDETNTETTSDRIAKLVNQRRKF